MDARLLELEALPTRTKAEKRELTALRKLDKALGKPAARLAQDLAELSTAANTLRTLGTAAAPFGDELAEGLKRAAIALNEREDFVGDHRALLTDGGEIAKLDRAVAKYTTARQKADAAADADDEARLLRPAEVKLTAALKLAEKLVRKTSKPLPPPRLRSGDLVGAGGGRVGVPRGSDTEIDRAAVLIPFGALTTPTAISITQVADFVGGRDVPAGEAVRFGPPSLSLIKDVTVFLPFALPAGTELAELGVFRDDAEGAALLSGTTFQTDGTLSAKSASLGTFQPGVPAPPVGAPDGRYVVTGLAYVAALGTTSGASFDPIVTASLLGQDFQFRRDRTGTASNGGLSFVSRAFLDTVPHHTEGSGATGSSYDFVWTADAANRFSFTFPAQPSGTGTAEGVCSTDGEVIVFSGHGGSFDFFAVGLRRGEIAAVADLAGRWAGVEASTQFLDADAEPFRTRWTSSSRTLDVSATGVVTFDAAGTVFRTDVRYDTHLAEPVHVLTTGTDADGGTVTLRVSPDGTLSDPAFLTQGYYAKGREVLVVGTHDAANGRVALTVAARQPATVDASAFEGAWNLARHEIGLTAGSPNARSSTHEPFGRRGTLVVDAGLGATESLDAATRAVYPLTGNPPLSSMTWTLAGTTAAESAASSQYVLAPDASGNDRTPAAPVWWSVAGDGELLLGALTASDAKASPGIVVGVK